MNALISLDSILEPQQALTATELFGSGQTETILAAIEKQVRAEVFTLDTEEGRERIKSVAYKIARSKTTLDEIGKEHVAHIKAQSAAIDAERRVIRDRLDALKDSVRKPLTDWEEAEASRVAGHEAALVSIIEAGNTTGVPIEGIRARLANVAALCGRAWEEFHERADVAATDTLAKLNGALAAAVQAEKDRAELEALRAEKAAREERDRQEAAAKAKAEAEAKAKAEAEAREKARAEQIERDKKEIAERAAAKAIEDERRRVAGEEARKAEEKAAQEKAERRRQADVEHRKTVLRAIIDAMVAAGASATIATVLAVEIDEGKIPHVSISY